MRIRKPVDAERAVRMYYMYTEIGNNEIKELLGITSPSAVVRLKKIARERMTEKGEATFNPNSVNTKSAYEAWGLNIEDLEKRFAKLKKLGMLAG